MCGQNKKYSLTRNWKINKKRYNSKKNNRRKRLENLVFLWYDYNGDRMIKVIKNGIVITMDEKREKYENIDIVIKEEKENSNNMY